MESTHLLPAQAELLGGRADEATDIRTDVRNTEEVELHRTNHRGLQVFPTRRVVSEPVSCPATR
jgi:hypothetical protein